MMEKQKLVTLFGKMAAASAISLLAFFAGSTTTYAAGYNLYIGKTQVTDSNADNIFGVNGADGQPTARYDAASKTLYLNGVHIDGTDDNKKDYYEVPGDDSNPTSHYSLYAGTDVVRHLVINGDNSFVSAGAENVYHYKAKETDEWDFTVDTNGDGKITTEDMTLSDILPLDRGCGGIYFSATGTEGETFTITGTGTLTSKSTEGYCHDYDDTNGELLGEDGYRREENMGTALTIEGKGWVYMGNEDGTGPRLNLTGWDVGADFRDTRKFAMQGGTVIAKATSTTKGTGVYLAGGTGITNFFEGGTIAAYGIADPGDTYKESGAFPNQDGAFDTKPSKDHGMQRVYPATVENDETDIYDDTRPIKIRNISGWAVVGMTATPSPTPENPNPPNYKAMTDAVLAELNLDDSGGGTDPVVPDGPGTGEGGGGSTDNPTGDSYHTDTLPDSNADINVWGYTEDKTVYSVDVEWGAMTFQYEKTKWNAGTHTAEPGRGWLIYDHTNDKIIDGTQNIINQVTVTNHSNAGVFAALSYAGTDSYTDIAGGFTKKDDDAATDFTPAADTVPAYLTLGTADNDKVTSGQGEETVGNVYFMPTGIGKTGETVNNIDKWQKIGKITVGIRTAAPTAP